MLLKHALAVVTGGGSGIGFAVAERFVSEGARVVISGRNAEKLQRAAEKLGENALPVVANAASTDDMQRLYQTAVGHFQCNVSVVVANAGISRQTPVRETSVEQFSEVLNINVGGVYSTVREALPFLARPASIILVASLAANQGTKNFSAYCASKAAVVSLAKSFAAEFVDLDIRVNSISPGVANTPIFDTLGMSEAQLLQWSNVIPMKRPAEPAEIAAAILFLASDASRYMTGTDLAVDGGMSGISPF
ncbi:short-chain dehydrogenase/reductase SDR [Caballeronia arationis]|jgi:NAD(P)-dependent dehydrogenase (short-subunit alcohol dehydrogenase family)|uniref:NAD(P)-dependent dehydrogenase, short-chain alcohol dehydrogenase family n=1 Tax=Caballeronia arationis TaxID=1777142 RepID=A0A7Z7N189_9BURK|nr:glucose 1-dehydrogenase [Caballeronia arationis]SAL02436.1 short-chain dehydrogenase/reductase SDR [Caballeronia arationis]SOE57325.1 NAD(P)-dependent dehydrogenase, short-chain alcohol dehydrogenase family [Caballeronia arationis]